MDITRLTKAEVKQEIKRLRGGDTWVTKERQTVLIDHLSPSHARNVLRMILRNRDANV